MLRMSKLADYGTVVMTFMARDPHRVHSAAEVAAHIAVGAPTVSKVLKTLARKGLLVSLRGAQGGYRLSCPPAKISVAQIIDAMDGPIGVTECSTMPGMCSQESGCGVRANWQKINQILLHALERITLEQMTGAIPEAINVSAMRRTGRREGSHEPVPT